MLRNYEDPPAGIVPTLGKWLAGCRPVMVGLYRAIIRD
jgi:hypothetical protein